MESVNQWLGAVAFLVSIVNVVAIWILRPGKIAKERHEALKTSVDERFAASAEASRVALKEHDRRIQALESDQKHLPTTDDLHGVKEALASLKAKVETEMESMGTTVRRIDDYLRSNR